MQTEAAYIANHNGIAFPIPKRLGLWDDKISKDAAVVEMKKAKAIHKACSKDYKIGRRLRMAARSSSALQWRRYINKLNDGTTFFHKIFAGNLLEHLKKTLQVSMPLTL
jgi:hypothetical protein